jgi:hypothetical protein
MNCGRSNREGKCNLKQIAVFHLPISEQVVRWCDYCGAVTVDEDCDGRVYAGQVRKMEFPTLAKEIKEK